MWGDWQLGYMQLSQYVLKHNWIEEKMRKVDPSIKTIGSGDIGSKWSPGMLQHCADHMDLLSEHFYCQSKPNVVEHVQQLPNNVKRIADAHRQFRKDIPALQGKNIRVALDEWNYWYGPHVFGELGTRYFLQDALGIAAGLHEYFRNSDIIFMANYAQTVQRDRGASRRRRLARSSTRRPCRLCCIGSALARFQWGLNTSPAPLDISAALTGDRRALTVSVVNPTRETVQLKLNLKSVRLAGNAQTWIIDGKDPMAFNQPGEPPQGGYQGGSARRSERSSLC